MQPGDTLRHAGEIAPTFALYRCVHGGHGKVTSWLAPAGGSVCGNEDCVHALRGTVLAPTDDCVLNVVGLALCCCARCALAGSRRAHFFAPLRMSVHQARVLGTVACKMCGNQAQICRIALEADVAGWFAAGQECRVSRAVWVAPPPDAPAAVAPRARQTEPVPRGRCRFCPFGTNVPIKSRVCTQCGCGNDGCARGACRRSTVCNACRAANNKSFHAAD